MLPLATLAALEGALLLTDYGSAAAPFEKIRVRDQDWRGNDATFSLRFPTAQTCG